MKIILPFAHGDVIGRLRSDGLSIANGRAAGKMFSKKTFDTPAFFKKSPLRFK